MNVFKSKKRWKNKKKTLKNVKKRFFTSMLLTDPYSVLDEEVTSKFFQIHPYLDSD